MFDDFIKLLGKLLRRSEAPETPETVRNEIKAIIQKTTGDRDWETGSSS